MESYSLQIAKSAAKEIEALPRKDRLRVIERIRGLAKNPRPAGAEKLSGEDKYRIRQGTYRIIYSIDNHRILIIIVKVGHRKEVYR